MDARETVERIVAGLVMVARRSFSTFAGFVHSHSSTSELQIPTKLEISESWGTQRDHRNYRSVFHALDPPSGLRCSRAADSLVFPQNRKRQENCRKFPENWRRGNRQAIFGELK